MPRAMSIVNSGNPVRVSSRCRSASAWAMYAPLPAMTTGRRAPASRRTALSTAAACATAGSNSGRGLVPGPSPTGCRRRSAGRLRCTAPVTPLRARRNASVTDSASWSMWVTCRAHLHSGAATSAWRISCWVPRPVVRTSPWPLSSTTGLPAAWAVASPVSALVCPGPPVTSATAGSRVARAYASAAMTAPASVRVSTSLIPASWSPSYAGRTWLPHSVNTTSMPSRCRHSASR